MFSELEVVFGMYFGVFVQKLGDYLRSYDAFIFYMYLTTFWIFGQKFNHTKKYSKYFWYFIVAMAEPKLSWHPRSFVLR